MYQKSNTFAESLGIMKKCLILFVAIVAFQQLLLAQTASGKQSSRSVAFLESGKNDAFHVSYTPIKGTVSYGDYVMSEDFKGFNVGWDHVTAIGKTPLFFEIGLGMDMAFCNDELYGISASMTLTDLKVPFSLSYDFVIPGTCVGLMPLAGVDFGAFISGKAKVTYGSKTKEKNLFEDEDYKRFILNYHVGARIMVCNSFFLEYRYEGPFVKNYKDGNKNVCAKRHNIGLGIFF